MLARALMYVGAMAVLGLIAVSVWVEIEADFTLEPLGGEGPSTALVLYHPSRDARFSEGLSLAVAEGFRLAGLAVERATMTGQTPGSLDTYQIVAVVSNTYYWTPDRPTLRFLARAELDGVRVIGLMGGAGSTARSERRLDEALRGAGGTVIDTRSFWLLRPNDETRMDEPNREVAYDLAERFAYEAATGG